MKLLNTVNEVIESSLNLHQLVSKEEDVIYDPIHFYKTKYKIIISVFGVIIAKIVSEKNIKSIEEVNDVLNNQLVNNIFTSSISELSDKEINIIERKLIPLAIPKDLSVMDLYEATLSQSFEPYNGVIHNKKSQSRIKRQGAYFTPHDLSNNCTKITIDKYIEENLGIVDFSKTQKKAPSVKKLLLNTKFADFSSGVGSFLIAILNYYKQYVDKQIPRQFAFCIFGFDVDFISLEIAKFEICRFLFDYSIFYELKNNFIVGNPLMDESGLDTYKKMDIFTKGFIYHSGLGINIYGKFDVILGNPPWEKVRFEDKQFFSTLYPIISRVNKKSDRISHINTISNTFPYLYDYYLTYKNELINYTKSKKTKNRFPLSSKGEINTYGLFSELSLKKQNKSGFTGLLVKSSFVTSKSNQTFFNYIVNEKKIVQIVDFVNTNKIFNVDSRERFSFVLFNDSHESFDVTMLCTYINDMLDSSRYISLSKEDLSLINPQTQMLPNTSDVDQISFLKSVMAKNTTFSESFPDAKFGRIVHYTLHSNSIFKTSAPDRLPIYEGKFIHIFDAKYSDFKNISDEKKYSSKASSRLISEEEKSKIDYVPVARYFIERTKWLNLTKNFPNKYSLMWRSLTSATNKRTCIATLMPHTPSSQSVQLLQLNDNHDLILTCAFFNSLVFDYIVRMKLNGIDLTQAIIKQMPIPSKNMLKSKITFFGCTDSIDNLIVKRVSALYINDIRFNELFRNIRDDYECRPDNRIYLYSELNILVAIAYGISKKNFKQILDHFHQSLSIKEKENLLTLSERFL